MKTKDILNLDLSDHQNRHIIAQALHKIPELQQYTDKQITDSVLEELLFTLCVDHRLFINGLYADVYASNEGIVWRLVVSRLDKKDVRIHCYGVTLFEVLAKGVIMVYSKVKKKRAKMYDS